MLTDVVRRTVRDDAAGALLATLNYAMPATGDEAVVDALTDLLLHGLAGPHPAG